MPRLFTALEVPRLVAMELSLLRGGLFGARWIDPENYHVTLRFIGDTDERIADEIAGALDRIDRRAFPVTISGLDAFGGKAPHALVARVEPNAAIVELAGEVERIVQRIGLPAEGRRFTPHVTLARLRGVSAGAVAAWLAAHGHVTATSFEAERFILYSSKSSVGGGPYRVEEAYPLAA